MTTARSLIAHSLPPSAPPASLPAMLLRRALCATLLAALCCTLVTAADYKKHEKVSAEAGERADTSVQRRHSDATPAQRVGSSQCSAVIATGHRPPLLAQRSILASPSRSVAFSECAELMSLRSCRAVH